MTWLAVFLGGGIGSLMRYATTLIVGKSWQNSFLLATLVSNFVACLLLGIAVALLREKVQNNELWYAFIVIGVCGGYSTFSTFAKENLDLIENGQWMIMLLNILISLSLCIGVIWLARK